VSKQFVRNGGVSEAALHSGLRPRESLSHSASALAKGQDLRGVAADMKTVGSQVGQQLVHFHGKRTDTRLSHGKRVLKSPRLVAFVARKVAAILPKGKRVEVGPSASEDENELPEPHVVRQASRHY
jgi:hypothetical protein